MRKYFMKNNNFLLKLVKFHPSHLIISYRFSQEDKSENKNYFMPKDDSYYQNLRLLFFIYKISNIINDSPQSYVGL